MRKSERGVTFLELIATAAILAILASAILPLGRVAAKRQKELELRRTLRQLRTAIDRYHDLSDPAGAGQLINPEHGTEGYPPDLETLVEGVEQVGRVDGVKLKFLRRIPKDPMTGEAEWGLRCYQDDADSRSWCGSNVWDVYSLSRGQALDGTEYREW